jgi:hypothetical protein
MAKYRKKPVVIEAIQWTGKNCAEIANFVDDSIPVIMFDKPLTVITLEGQHKASINDWIIKGVKGEFYPCKPDIFAATYDPAE